MRLFIALLLCIVLNPIRSQDVFSKSYDFEQDEEYGTCIKQWGNDFVIIAPSVCNDNTVFCKQLLKINKDGEVLWKKTLNYFKRINSINQYSLNTVGENLLVGITGEDPDLKQFIDLRLLSPDGDSLWSVQIRREQNLIITSFIVTDKGNIICLAAWYDWSIRKSTHVFIVKLNPNGDIIWEQKINDRNHKGLYPSMITGLPNEKFLITTLYCKKGDNCGNQGKQLWYMDAEGNKIWEKSFVGEPWGKFPAAVGLNNGNFAMSYKRYDWPNTQIQAPPCVQGLSPNKDSLWEHCFLNFLHVNIFSMRKANNGDIIGCGAKGHGEPGQSGWLFRMTQEGEVLWERNVFYDLDPYTGHWGGDFWGITEDDEGNIWVAGSCSDTFPNHNPMRNSNNAWVLKLSSNGCLFPGCTDEIQLVSDYLVNIEELSPIFFGQNTIVAFPNPTKNNLDIKVKVRKLISWTLYNGFGSKLGTKIFKFPKAASTLDLSLYNSGDYYLNIKLDDSSEHIVKIIKQ